MLWPEFAQIKEVGPRDGLQNKKKILLTENKIECINMLTESSVKEIESSSFVNPKWIPALKDAREVGKKIKRNPNVIYSALVPNEKGLEYALEAGIDVASVFMSTSETHNLKNINKTIAETYPVVQRVIEGAKQENKRVTGYVSTVFDCPFEGKIAIDNVIKVVDKLFELGVDDVSLGDTIGSAVPSQVENLLEAVLYHYPRKNIIMHFHDTRGMAIANIVTAMQYGVVRFDSSLGGLGGCPYAPGAAGNVSTNDLLYLLKGLGIQTGINTQKIDEASLFIQQKLGKKLPSRNLAYYTSQMKQNKENQTKLDQKVQPLRKREIIYFFLKDQYKKIRNKSS